MPIKPDLEPLFSIYYPNGSVFNLQFNPSAFYYLNSNGQVLNGNGQAVQQNGQRSMQETKEEDPSPGMSLK